MKKLLGLLLTLLISSPALGVDINGQLKKAQLEQQSSDPTAATARVYFNTLTNTAKIYNGTAWTSLGSGAGSGEKNYVSNGSSSAVGWTASSGNITCATTTSSMPDPSLGTALAVTGVSGSTDFCYTNFALDDADFAKKLKLAWDQYAVSNTSADFRVDVCACAVAWSGGACSAGTVAQGCGTNSTRLPLSTDASSASLLPALTGSYRTTYDAIGTSKKYMQVQVGLAQTNTHQVNLANIVTGPGIVTQGAAVTQWVDEGAIVATNARSATSWTLAGSTTAPTFASTTTVNHVWTRHVGDTLDVRLEYSQGALTGAASGSGYYILYPPTKYTIDTAKYSNTGSNSVNNVGTGTIYDGATLNLWSATPYSGGIIFNMFNNGTTYQSWGSTAVAVNNANLQFSIVMALPVAEFSGGGVVNLAYSGTATATVSCDTPNGHGSTNTKIRRYTNCTSTGTAITYADSATLGASYTINEAGVYSMTTSDKNSAAADVLGLSVNTSAPTTAIQSLSTSERLLMFEGTSNSNASGSVTAKLNAGDVVRVHDDGTPNSAAAYSIMKIAKVVNDPTGAVGFANASSTSNGLVSYESCVSYSNSGTTLTWSVTPSTWAVKFCRVGKIVTVDVNYSSVTPGAGSVLAISGYSADFKPPSSKWCLLSVIAGATNNTASIDSDSDGHLYIYASANAGTWSGSTATNTGNVSVGFSYNLQ